MEKPRYIREAEEIISHFDGIHNIGYHIQSMDKKEQGRLADEVWRKIDRSQNVIDYFQSRTEQAFAIGGNSFVVDIPGDGESHKVRIFPTRLNAIRRMSDRQEQYIAGICSDPTSNESYEETISSDPSADEL